MKRQYFLVVAWLLACLAGGVQAAEAGPHEVIAASIERITARIDAERARIKADPEYARKMVDEELSGLVDFKRITRLVMAQYFDQASKEQKYRFLDVFRNSLIGTYSSGLTLYEGQEIRVLPAAEGDVRDSRAAVRTEIATNAGKVIPVSFSLYRDRDGNWLVENVIVNGLNLGKTFRSQFDQSVQQYQGDLDKVIANWSSAIDLEGQEKAAAPASGA